MESRGARRAERSLQGGDRPRRVAQGVHSNPTQPRMRQGLLFGPADAASAALRSVGRRRSLRLPGVPRQPLPEAQPRSELEFVRDDAGARTDLQFAVRVRLGVRVWTLPHWARSSTAIVRRPVVAGCLHPLPPRRCRVRPPPGRRSHCLGCVFRFDGETSADHSGLLPHRPPPRTARAGFRVT